MDRELSNKTDYIIACISEFATRFQFKLQPAHAYLSQYLGIDFLLKHYEALHTLSIDEAVEDIT
ncbi:MAG: DUF3791 domain-containing protein [Bacteroidales bacterium]|nr:DUF3791 domain-containing protein [Bacteroidales bacterium]